MLLWTKLLYLFKVLNVMKQNKPILLPKTEKILKEFGENIKLARLRRRLSTEQIAERANLSRTTLWQIEKGSPGVAIGNYIQVLFILGLEKDILLLAKDDALGRKLQDANLIVKERAPKRKYSKNVNS